MHVFNYSSIIWMDRIRGKKNSQDCTCSNRDSNMGLPKYKILTLYYREVGWIVLAWKGFKWKVYVVELMNLMVLEWQKLRKSVKCWWYYKIIFVIESFVLISLDIYILKFQNWGNRDKFYEIWAVSSEHYTRAAVRNNTSKWLWSYMFLTNSHRASD